MAEIKEIHLEGKLASDDCGVKFKGGYLTLASEISQKLEELFLDLSPSKAEEDPNATDISLCTPPISFKVFLSDNKCSLKEAENKQILASVGELDIYQEWFGYSEFTVMGYDVINFALTSEDGSGHDLQQFFTNYIGKYTHIVISTVNN